VAWDIKDLEGEYSDKCVCCGSPAKIVGTTTQYYVTPHNKLVTALSLTTCCELACPFFARSVRSAVVLVRVNEILS
jgi:hypothetical protein